MKKSGGLIEGFLFACERYPENQALQLNDQSFTYQELCGQAFKLAGVIQEREAEARPLAAVFASRSLSAYVGVLGVLASGRGYVSLNPRFPLERNLHMLELAEVSTVVIGKEILPFLEQLLPRINNHKLFICPDLADVDELQQSYPLHCFVGEAELSGRATKSLPGSRKPVALLQQTAYVMFTSGSTGEPKGVPISHVNVLAYIDYVSKRYAVQPRDRFSQMFDLTFDLSVHDMFVCWQGGACLCPVPETELMAPARFIREKELTMWFSVPSVAMFMKNLKLLKPGAFPSLRCSLFCGEALSVRLADAWQKAAPNSILENLYGPTEATIAIAHYSWDERRSPAESCNGIVPIGSIFPGQKGLIVDEAIQEVRKGQPGELCLAGAQITDGYLNDGEKTKKQFVCLDAFPGHIFYRTGDRVQEDDSGILHYLGRNDDQVQILGHRVELLEIDHVLREACGGKPAVAVAWPLKEGRAEGIYGFIQGGEGIDLPKVLSACREHLPGYMIPRKILLVDAFPLNASGKTDRRALAAKLEKASS